jgi:hypothetical protein
VYRLGKSGHKQYGFDVLVEQDGAALAAIQYKRVRQFGPREVTKAVAAAAMEVATALIFLSRAASPDARAALRAHRGVAAVGQEQNLPRSARSASGSCRALG